MNGKPNTDDLNMIESNFKDLGPIDSKRPNVNAFVYRPENYNGPIALNATIQKQNTLPDHTGGMLKDYEQFKMIEYEKAYEILEIIKKCL